MNRKLKKSKKSIFTVNFDQFNVSFLNNSVIFFQNEQKSYWLQTLEHWALGLFNGKWIIIWVCHSGISYKRRPNFTVIFTGSLFQSHTFSNSATFLIFPFTLSFWYPGALTPSLSSSFCPLPACFTPNIWIQACISCSVESLYMHYDSLHSML